MDVAETEFAEAFYSRQTILKELGASGQRKLAGARVAVVGVGGLGTVSSLYLALAGVGYLRLIDQDTVELHNLHRQILYTPSDLHYPKAEAAAKRLHQVNPTIEVKAVPENVNAANVTRLLKDVDCVVDGLDNMATRYVVNRACIQLGLPYVFGAAIGLEGNLSVFSPPQTGCLECLLPSLSDRDLQTCSSRGVLGATPGVIGSLQALETLKLLAGIGTPLKGKLLVCDFSDMDFIAIDISKNIHCPACHRKTAEVSGEPRFVWLCGKDTANINPPQSMQLRLDELAPKIDKQFSVRLRSQLAVMFTYGGFEVSLFNGGRMLIKGVADEESALRVYHEVLERLGLV